MARVPKKHEGVKDLLDNLSEALVILDPALEVVEWNPAMERLTGVRSADAVGRSAAALLPLFRDTTLVPLDPPRPRRRDARRGRIAPHGRRRSGGLAQGPLHAVARGRRAA